MRALVVGSQQRYHPLVENRPRPAATLPQPTRQIIPLLQKKKSCACGGDCPRCQKQQQAEQPTLHTATSPVPGSSGQALDAATRDFMESRFGYDFGQVRVHADAGAAQSAGAVNALAYTVGQNLVFGAGQYAPQTVEGRRLLAHELTHVVQQSGGARPGPTAPSGLLLQRAPLPAISAAPSSVQRKADPFSIPVPTWERVPEYAQKELELRGYDQTWFESNIDILRLTLLNLYVKLSGLGLWKFVQTQDGHGPGILHFKTDVTALKQELRDRPDFTSPEESPDQWSSRELRASNALHLKHFKGSPPDQVQAQIDQKGLLFRSKWWWLLPVVPLGQMLAPGLAYYSYQEVVGIRDILLGQGWDPAPLLGVGAPATQATASATAKPLRSQDCSLEQRAYIRHHLDKGRLWAINAARLLRPLRRNPSLETLSPTVAIALTKHFRIDEVPEEDQGERLLEILRGFEETAAGFANPPFECEMHCDEGEHAYVYAIARSLSNIHICWRWFELADATRRTVDIIHEVAHKYADKDDEKTRVKEQQGDRTRVAYEFNKSAYEALTADEAVHNADCYAVFARDVY